MKIYCCQCEVEVEARLTDGFEIYPHREDLASLPFWKCDACGNFVGCHHKTKEPTKPLGVIPTPEIKAIRQQIHRVLDPLWKSKRYSRSDLYAFLSKCIGKQYHTAELHSVAFAKYVLDVVNHLADNHMYQLAYGTYAEECIAVVCDYIDVFKAFKETLNTETYNHLLWFNDYKWDDSLEIVMANPTEFLIRKKDNPEDCATFYIRPLTVFK